MSTTTNFDSAVSRLRDGASVEGEIENLLSELSADEKLGLLDGDVDFWPGLAVMVKGYNLEPIIMGSVPRLGIPGLRFSDGPRGVVVGASTAFPVSMARGATWDTDLEERIGLAIGKEMRAKGANFFGGVCINLPRHPAWGRAQETYSEDPIVLGEFGAALIRGVRHNAMAVAKHFALNSMENARFTVDVTADEATLHEVYLPHFRRAIEAGADGIMTAYNSVNGEWAGQNEELLEGILRGRWGFEGVTVSDFTFGFRDAAISLRAGLDVEEPFRQQRGQHLPADLEAGRASWNDVDRAARRILGTQLRFYASNLDPEPGAEVVFSSQHRALAREAASTAAVLLQNEPVDGSPLLPLSPDTLNRVAVIGRLADLANTGDHGSSDVRSPEVVTPLTGLRDALPDATLDFVGDDDPSRAAATAAGADVAIVVIGYTAEDEGEYMGQELMEDPALTSLFPPLVEGSDAPEFAVTGDTKGTVLMGAADGGDRASIRVRPIDADIIRATVNANPKTVVVLVTAGAVVMEEWRHEVAAVLVGWYSGSEGGAALADVLLGQVDATGRLPYSIPTQESHLPFFDPLATSIEYDRWYGQRLLDRDGHTAAFPLGFGLSYTTFKLGALAVGEVTAEAFPVTVDVTNTGSRRGRHVVQVYGVIDADDFPSRVLLGFAPVWVEAGSTVTAHITASTRPLHRWAENGFTAASPQVTIEAASFSGDPEALTDELALPAPTQSQR